VNASKSGDERERRGRSLGVRGAIIGAFAAFFTVVSLPVSPPVIASTAPDADDLLIVDCLLPGKVRKLGRKMTYQQPRRALKTSALDCSIRGGEYTDYDRASYQTALETWLDAAEAGDPQAQNYVGEIYEKGLGTQPDFAAAAIWYRKAAEQGYATAQINLGQLYETGRGVPEDRAEALRWYRKASGLPDFIPSAPPSEVAPPALEPEPEPPAPTTSAPTPPAPKPPAPKTADAKPPAPAPPDPELARLRKELGQRDRELEKMRQDLADLKLEQKKSTAGASSHAAAVARQKQIDALESKIGTMAQSKPESGEGRARRPARKFNEPVPGPTIAMLDPEIPETRGLRVVEVPKANTDQRVMGRVQAPAGLASLTVNDRKAAVTPVGVFEIAVMAVPGRSDVIIVAIDRQGKRAQRKFVIESGGESLAGSRMDTPPPKTRVDFGRYHALVIGNNAYENLPPLSTARADATAISGVLRRHYGMEVTTLLDATRYDILSALNKLRSELGEEDNLLIYYAGHGELDEVNDRGHWLPVDAEPDSSANWISNVALTDILNAMKANHVMVVADSCYSGALTRSSLAHLDAGIDEEGRTAWIETMVKKRSRTALTSGGDAPVLDVGSGKHSIFAKALLDVLGPNADVMEGQRLYQEIAARVTVAAAEKKFDQRPQYAPIRFSKHESGDFFFVPGG
jgi:hypothetical protein